MNPVFRERRLVHVACLLFGTASVCFALVETARSDRTNAKSRFATMESLVHRGTYAIDRSPFKTIDKVRVGDRYISSKPPVFSTIGAGVYAAVRHFTGFELHPERRWMRRIIKIVIGVIPHLILLVFFFRLMQLLRWRESTQLLIFAALSFGYLGSGYAAHLNNHSPAAAACLVGGYYVLSTTRGRSGPWGPLVAGFALALASVLDLGASLVALALGLRLLATKKPRTIALFVLAALPPLIAHFWLNLALTGSVLPAYIQSELYQYPGSVWIRPKGIDALNEPKWLYAFHSLLGHHGMLSMTPVFFLGLWTLVKRLRTPGPLRTEVIGIGAFSLALVFVYVMTSHNYGGGCVGMRWYLVLHPFWFVLAGMWLNERSLGSGVVVLFTVLFGISALHTTDAYRAAWVKSGWHRGWEATFAPWRLAPLPAYVPFAKRAPRLVLEDDTHRMCTQKRKHKESKMSVQCAGESRDVWFGAHAGVVFGRFQPCIRLTAPRRAKSMDITVMGKMLRGIEAVRFAVEDSDWRHLRGEVLVEVESDDGWSWKTVLTPQKQSATMAMGRRATQGQVLVRVTASDGTPSGVCMSFGEGPWR